MPGDIYGGAGVISVRADSPGHHRPGSHQPDVAAAAGGSSGGVSSTGDYEVGLILVRFGFCSEKGKFRIPK